MLRSHCNKGFLMQASGGTSSPSGIQVPCQETDVLWSWSGKNTILFIRWWPSPSYTNQAVLAEEGTQVQENSVCQNHPTELLKIWAGLECTVELQDMRFSLQEQAHHQGLRPSAKLSGY
jgi:hypothetical protein